MSPHMQQLQEESQKCSHGNYYDKPQPNTACWQEGAPTTIRRITPRDTQRPSLPRTSLERGKENGRQAKTGHDNRRDQALRTKKKDQRGIQYSPRLCPRDGLLHWSIGIGSMAVPLSLPAPLSRRRRRRKS